MNDRKHPENHLLQTYSDGELSGEAATQVRNHLAGCSTCRTYLSGIAQTRSSIRSVGGVVLPSDFASGVASEIRSRIEEEQEWSIIEKTAEKILTGIALAVILLMIASDVFTTSSEPADIRSAGLLDIFIRDTTVVRIVTAESLTRDDILAVALTREEGPTP